MWGDIDLMGGGANFDRLYHKLKCTVIDIDLTLVISIVVALIFQ